MFVFKLSPDISPSVCSCNASSSGFVRIGSNRQPRSEVHKLSVFVFRFLPASLRHHHLHLPFGVLPVDFLFWTIFNFPFKMSRSISSHLPYSPWRLRRQCLFLELISPLVLMAGYFCVFLSVWNNGPELNFRLIIFPVSVFTVLSVPLMAVCILFWNLPFRDFLL